MQLRTVALKLFFIVVIAFPAFTTSLSHYQRDPCQSEREYLEVNYLQKIKLDTVTRFTHDFGCVDSIPPEVFSMKQLEYLEIGVFLSGKKIQKEIGQLKNLKRLWFGKSKIESIPPEIGQLTHLEELFIPGGRKLTHVPKEIGNCTKLKKIDFFRNNLTTLPDEIGQLKNLEILNLIENNFSKEERERIKKLLPHCKIHFDY